MHAVVIPIETNWLNFYQQPQNKNDVVQPQVELENDGSNRDEVQESQDYNVIGSFTQLITAPTCDEENLQFQCVQAGQIAFWTGLTIVFRGLIIVFCGLTVYLKWPI